MKNLKRTIRYSFYALLSVFVLSCTSDKDFNNGARQLRSQGYTSIKNTGYNMFCCGEDDGYSTGFEARDKNGVKVSGCFCSALFKGVTIRFE